MNPLLSEIYSIINGYSDAKDTERVFTFIEFVKQFGYDNDTNVFINAYKDYVTQWGIVKKDSLNVSTEDFVMTRLIDVLKSITLDYSSYEEQDFISHIDFNNKDHLKGLCALYSRKIRQIANYYRTKRNETSQIVKRNSQKGTVKSLQEIIYEKIFDYLFSDRNILPSYQHIKRDLVVSVENYIDTYSDYFDIPREEKVDTDSRSKMLNQLLDELEAQNALTEDIYVSSENEDSLTINFDTPVARIQPYGRMRSSNNEDVVEEVIEDTSVQQNISDNTSNPTSVATSVADNANKNDVDYKVFLEDTSMLVADMLFSGDVHLKELPLVAQLSVDLSQKCVGDMLALKNQLLKDTTVGNVDLEERIELKKQLYEKFIGVDIWYAYVDPNGDVKIDELCRAKNPTGNLLNVISSDSATIEKNDNGALNQVYGGSGSKSNGAGGTGGTGGGTTKFNAGLGESSSGNSATGSGSGGTGSDSGSGSGGTGSGSSGGGVTSSSGFGSGLDSGWKGYGSGTSQNKDALSGIVNPSDYFGDNNGYSNETGYYNRQSTSGGDGGSGFGSGSGSSVEQDGYLELLSRIGLFFKPDKTSILTVNSKNFTWSIDTDALIPDTIYIFPDPNKYGDIGNNKSAQYPLIMEHKLNYDIKNTSSGFAKNDPILYLANQGWFSYYSKQQDDFKIYDNKKYEYSFTSLANKGFISNYQTDIWGNEFGVLKGYTVNKIIDDRGVEKWEIETYPQYIETAMKNDTNDIVVNDADKKMIFNGGYFRDPFDVSSGSEKAFDYTRRMVVADTESDRYILSGVTIDNKGFYHPLGTTIIPFGTSFRQKNDKGKYIHHFGQNKNCDEYHNDHYNTTVQKYEDARNEVIVSNSTPSTNVYGKTNIIKKTNDFNRNVEGELWVKLLGNKPEKFEDVFKKSNFREGTGDSGKWFEDGEYIIDFSVVAKNIIIETNKRYQFIYYNYNGDGVTDSREVTEIYKISKDKISYNISNENEIEVAHHDVIYDEMIYNENDKCFYTIIVETLTCDIEKSPAEIDNNSGVVIDDAKIEKRVFLIPRIYKFNTETYSMTDILYTHDCVCYDEIVESGLYQDNNITFEKRMMIKDTISHSKDNLNALIEILTSQSTEDGYKNLSNFEIPFIENFKLEDASFSYNDAMKTFLFAYSLNDLNGTPYLYQHKFKLGDIDTFNDTLQSKMFSMVKEGTSYKWNNKINASSVNVVPSEGGSIIDNTIWIGYTGDGHANNGINFGEAQNQKINELTVSPWESFVYKWDKHGCTKQEGSYITGDFEWIGSNDSYEIMTGINKFGIRINNMIVHLNDGSEIIFTNQFGDYIDVIRDVLGKFYGVKTVRLVKENLQCPENFTRKMVVEITVQVEGDSDGIGEVHATAIAKDILIVNEQTGDDTNEDVIIDNDKFVKVGIGYAINEYNAVTNEEKVSSDKKIICKSLEIQIDGDKNEFARGENKCSIIIPKEQLQLVHHSTNEVIDYFLIEGEETQMKFDFQFEIPKDASLSDEINVTHSDALYSVKLHDNESKNGTVRIKSAKYVNGFLEVQLELQVDICVSNYECYIGFDKYGTPIKFELGLLEDASHLFENSYSTTTPWSLCDNNSQDAIKMTSALKMTSMCHNSNCAQVYIQNSKVKDTSNMVSECKNLVNFQFIGDCAYSDSGDSTYEVIPFAETITARHMFFGTYPNIDNLSLQERDYISQIIEPTPSKFENYEMSNLRNAEGMFYKKISVKKDGENFIKSYINDNHLIFNTERVADFETIKFTTPKLICAPMMFWNRPLNYKELEHFANGLHDISDSQNGSKLRKRFDEWINRSWDDIVKDETYNELFEPLKTVEEWDSNISWDKKIEILSKISQDERYSPILCKDETNHYSQIFPSISIWVNEAETKENLQECKNILVNIAKKGWEVSTNLEISDDTYKNILKSDTGNYLIRAYEYGNSTGEPFICDEDLMTSNIQSVDYLIDICKTVLNPIELPNTDSYHSWIKLCMAWYGASIPSANEQRNKYTISQVLGNVDTTVSGFGTISKASLFDGNPNGNHCSSTWYNGSIDSFKRQYKLYFKNR